MTNVTGFVDHARGMGVALTNRSVLFSQGVSLVADIGCELGHRGRDPPMPYNYSIVLPFGVEGGGNCL